MKLHSAVMALIVVNLLFLGFQFARGAGEQKEPVASVVRARALEIVDDNGQVRAEIKVCPAQPNLKMPDGSVGYPETVLLRWITSKGAPNVKLSATEDGFRRLIGG